MQSESDAVSVNILAEIGSVTTVALKLPLSVWIFPPELAPTVGATEGFGVTDGLGATEGFSVGVGEGLGDGLGEGEGLGVGVKTGDGEADIPSGAIYDRDAAYTVSPKSKAKTKIKGSEMIPELLNFLGINNYRIKV